MRCYVGAPLINGILPCSLQYTFSVDLFFQQYFLLLVQSKIQLGNNMVQYNLWSPVLALHSVDPFDRLELRTKDSFMTLDQDLLGIVKIS